MPQPLLSFCLGATYGTLKSFKISGQLLLRDSLDSNVWSINTELTPGKWDPSKAIEDAE